MAACAVRYGGSCAPVFNRGYGVGDGVASTAIASSVFDTGADHLYTCPVTVDCHAHQTSRTPRNVANETICAGWMADIICENGDIRLC